MTVEQIAIRQEIRQMLNEAGVNKNTLKDMVKSVLQEELEKAIRQVLKETNTEHDISIKVKHIVDEKTNSIVREEIRKRVSKTFGGMTISVDITDNEGQSVATKIN